MKKVLILFVLFTFPFLVTAECPAPTTIAVHEVTTTQNIPEDVAVQGRAWIQGLNNIADGAGTDCDGMSFYDYTCNWYGLVGVMEPSVFCYSEYELPPGWFPLTDWIATPYDGCPGQTGDERLIILCSNPNNGYYTLQSKRRGDDWQNWDSCGGEQAQPFGARGELAGATFTDDPNNNDGDIDQITFSFGSYFLYGNYCGYSQPVSPIPTQYNVYIVETNGATAPTDFNITTGGWQLLGTYNVSQTTITNLPIPAKSNPNNRQYLSIAPIYEGWGPNPGGAGADGYRYMWVANNPILISASALDPPGGVVITSISAKSSGLETTVTWKSADESRVTYYQVYWAPANSNEFTAVGSPVSPKGSNSTYSVNVRIPAQGSFQVKVGAHKVDGTVEYSSVATVKSSIAIKDKTRVIPN